MVILYRLNIWLKQSEKANRVWYKWATLCILHFCNTRTSNCVSKTLTGIWYLTIWTKINSFISLVDYGHSWWLVDYGPRWWLVDYGHRWWLVDYGPCWCQIIAIAHHLNCWVTIHYFLHLNHYIVYVTPFLNVNGFYYSLYRSTAVSSVCSMGQPRKQQTTIWTV